MLPERFMAKVVHAPNGCWLWTADHTQDGYGLFKFGKRMMLAHRFAYEQERGPIPVGLQLDHFYCDTRRCANPEHVRPVTPRENALRSNSLASFHAAKTHCPAGHPYDEANTKRYRGHRACRTCHQLHNREYRRRLREAGAA